MGCCNTNSQCLIVTTINPIWHSHPVHPGTNNFTICSLKCKENIIFAHNYFRKTNTNQASHCFDLYLSIVFLVKGLDTSNQLQSILTLTIKRTVSQLKEHSQSSKQGACESVSYSIFC